jgi:hypothetical protein
VLALLGAGQHLEVKTVIKFLEKDNNGLLDQYSAKFGSEQNMSIGYLLKAVMSWKKFQTKLVPNISCFQRWQKSRPRPPVATASCSSTWQNKTCICKYHGSGETFSRHQ